MVKTGRRSLVYLIVTNAGDFNTPFFKYAPWFHAVHREWKPVFGDIIEAMVAGAAGFHIALSTISFKIAHRASPSRLLEKRGAENLVNNPEFVEDVRKESTPVILFLSAIAAVSISIVFVFVAPRHDVLMVQNASAEIPQTQRTNNVMFPQSQGHNPLTKGK